METIGLIAFRKVVGDFAAVCKTIKQELDLAPGIKDEVVKLGNQMDAELNALGETLRPLVGTLEEQEAAEPDATGNDAPLEVK